MGDVNRVLIGFRVGVESRYRFSHPYSPFAVCRSFAEKAKSRRSFLKVGERFDLLVELYTGIFLFGGTGSFRLFMYIKSPFLFSDQLQSDGERGERRHLCMYILTCV